MVDGVPELAEFVWQVVLPVSGPPDADGVESIAVNVMVLLPIV